MSVPPKPKPLSPLAIADAMKLLNDAAVVYMALVDSVAGLLVDESNTALTPQQLEMMGRKLHEATETFGKVIHPE